jgi:ribosomal protein S18 acetylase RimI-like enzyme
LLHQCLKLNKGIFIHLFENNSAYSCIIFKKIDSDLSDIKTMQIVELTTANETAYKEFFREGLTTHPHCFRISQEDVENEPFPTSGIQDSFTLASVTEDGQINGVVSFQREGCSRERLRHKGLLFRMYVSEKYRGLGIGKQLIQELLNRVNQIHNIEQINLTVISDNVKAKNLYEKFGFSTFSIEKHAIKDGSQYRTEEQMVLFLERG